MQTTHKISGTAASGFASYLTSESGRGDYYAGHESSDGEEGDGGLAGVGQSRWHGSGELLAGLGLGADAPVAHDDLLSLMQGVSPVDGRELRAAGGNGTRVAGIDLTFSAPKSVSALWAVSGREDRVAIERAHGRAVASTLAHVERDVELLRSRVGGELGWERAESLLAAEFVHTSSRLTVDQEQGGVPDPQLHSHVVVLGAQRLDGRFAAVDSRELFRSARMNGAWYRSELANELGKLGLVIEARTGRDGRYFELAGIPQELAERWSARSSDIQRAAARFRDRYGRDPRAGELGSLTVATRGTKTMTAAVSVDAAWRAVGEEYGLSRERTGSLFGVLSSSFTSDQASELAGTLLSDLTREQSVVRERDLGARAYELSAGVCEPVKADCVVAGLVQAGELVALRGGLWTTRELREREQATLALASSRAEERAAPVSEQALRSAQREVGREIGGSLSAEQRAALETITGLGGVSVLVGQAGTGKGVVLSAAANAWRQEGYQVIGTAIAGATAERLGADAKLERAVNTSALLAGIESGHTQLGPDSVVVMDEAGMADTARLSALVEATAERQSKLVLVGDQAQLSPIAAGGMFAELQEQLPSAELSEVHRAHQQWEREAWAQLREGEAHRALASYEAHERLHIADTREEAAQQMLADWAAARSEDPGQRTVMLTDASNAELDQINALAQAHRAQAGELGSDRVELPDRPYALAAGDQVIFTGSLRQTGAPRVENGTLGTVASTDGEQRLTVQTQGAHERDVQVSTEKFSDLRLAYAQHVYKAQGLTVQHAFVLTGGWQTDRERSYVALSRAQERTDIYVSREDLGEQGLDAGAIERLGEAMSESHAKQASIATPTAEITSGLGPDAGADPPTGPDIGPTGEPRERESEVGRLMREQQEREREQDLNLTHGIE
ncbi:MAG TPA: MobF family relaxase [Solirubrobacteraceae bacterium]